MGLLPKLKWKCTDVFVFLFSGKHDINCRSLGYFVSIQSLFKYGISEILWYLSMLNWCCTYSPENWWRLSQQALMRRGQRPETAGPPTLCKQHLLNPHQQLYLGGPVETYTTTKPVDSVQNCLHKTHLSIVIWALNALPCNRSYRVLYVFSYKYNSYNIKTGVELLAHWDRDNMADISQTTLSIAFSWMKMLEFRLDFHWSLFPRVQLTIFQHWFR